MINIKFVATEQPPKSPKQFASILRTSLQQCLHHRHNRILVDVEDSVSLDVEKSNARDKTKRELARLLIEMFYGTHIPVKVAFCNTKELQVAQTTWGLSTQWVAYCLLEKVGKRGFQEEEFGRNVAEEHIIICVDPKPQQLSCLESYLTGPGQVVVLVNPRRIQQQAELLSSLNLILKRYTAALVLRKYTIRGERCLLYNRFPNSWCLFSFQSRQKRLLYKSKNLPADEQSLFASPPPVNNKPIWHWPWDNSSSWWFMKDL
ncbi:hypothetical protein Gasu2_65920 [Galdieria sulphuraria]|nr:hypothetical protein Gasu2_65920 [Galdieria sulphuraria]